MKKSTNTSPFQPKTIMLALSTLFLAGSLYAQPMTQTPPAPPNQATEASPQTPHPCAKPGPHGKRGHHGKHGRHAMSEVLRTLQLTPEQQTQLDQIADNLAQKRIPLVEQMRDLQIKLNEQAYLAQLDTTTMALLQEQRNKLRQELSALNDSARLQALSLLTPEQRIQLGEQWKQWHPPMPTKKDRPAAPRRHAEALLFPSGHMMP